MWLDRIHLPCGTSLRAFIAGILIPGYAFQLRRERLVARVVMAAYAMLGLVFLIWIGYPVANYAFGLMLSLHVTSIIYLCSPWLSGVSLPFRLLAGVAVLIVVGGLVYSPMLSQIQNRWLMPMRVNGEVVVVQTFSSAQSVRRGDWVAYSIAAEGQRGMVLRAGFGIRPVMAVSGDRVRFTSGAYEVNGVSHPRSPHMPSSGEIVVPENHWFIWPDLAISYRGNVAPADVDSIMLGIASIRNSQFVGKPLQRWFWRRQKLE